MIEGGLGILGWSAPDFWSATPREYDFAMKGWMRKNGVSDSSPRMTKDRVNELAAQYPDDPKE